MPQDVTSPKASDEERVRSPGRRNAETRAGTGFDFLDTFDVGVLFVGLAVFAAVGALSHQHERAFSASLIYLGLGAAAAVALGWLDAGWIDPIGDADLIEHLAEAALVLALFSAGLKLDRPLTFRDWSSVARLLLLAMPLTIGAVALLGDALLGLSAAGALLLGAALAPTDPVLAGDIGVGPPGDEDEHEPNFALTAEAGLNDGLAAPFVLAGLFVAEQGGTGWVPEWLAADVVYAIAVGVAIGAGRRHARRLERQAAAQPRHARRRVRRLPRDRHRARHLRAGRARRRLRLPRRVRGRARVPPLRARPRGQPDGARGRRADGEAARAGRDPAARLDAHDRRAERARLGGLARWPCCCSWSSGRSRA